MRARIKVAEALSRLAKGKRFVEIGTRRGDVLSTYFFGFPAGTMAKP